MNIDLRGVFSGRVKQLPINEKFDFSTLELNGSTPVASLVSVDCVVGKKADIVKIEGKAVFTYEAPCDRCATLTKREFEIPIEHIIVNSVENEDEEVIKDDVKNTHHSVEQTGHFDISATSQASCS